MNAMSLSQVLMTTQAAEMVVALVELSGDANLRIEGANDVCVHYVLKGELNFSGGGINRPISAGDFICMTRGGDHVLTTNDRSAPECSNLLQALKASDEPVVFKFGESGAGFQALLLSGSFNLRRKDGTRAPTLMPDVLVIHASDQQLSSFEPSALLIESCKGPGASGFAASVLQTLMYQALRAEIYRRLGDKTPSLHNVELYRIISVLSIMDREYKHPWTVAELAELAGMSRSVFAVEFQTTIGDTPFSKLSAIRLEEASRRLLEDTRIGEIATSVGYRSVAAFSRAFHNRFGEWPAEMRKRLKAKADPSLPAHLSALELSRQPSLHGWSL
jgi:AraC-like DNA-binding protein